MRPVRPHHRALGGLAVAAAAVVVLTGACGVPDDGVTAIEPDELPESLRPSSTTSSVAAADPPQHGAVSIYWIRDNLLVPETIAFEAAPDAVRVVSILERGPGQGGAPTSERSVVSRGDVIDEVDQNGDLVLVELSDAFAEVAGADQLLAVGQIVATLTSVPGIESVEVRRAGKAIDVPLPDGTLVRRPLQRADYASLLDPEPAAPAADR